MGADEGAALHHGWAATSGRRSAFVPLRGQTHGGSSWDVPVIDPQPAPGRTAAVPWPGYVLVYRVGAGVLSGVAGGAVFGVIMHVSGALVMVARLVDGQSVAVGWAVHLAISAFVGITFGAALGPIARGRVVPILLGISYGWLWWVLGGLTLMPLRLGMGLFVFNADAFKSLAGHLAYGLALGAVYAALTRTRPVGPHSRRSPSSQPRWQDRGHG